MLKKFLKNRILSCFFFIAAVCQPTQAQSNNDKVNQWLTDMIQASEKREAEKQARIQAEKERVAAEAKARHDKVNQWLTDMIQASEKREAEKQARIQAERQPEVQVEQPVVQAQSNRDKVNQWLTDMVQASEKRDAEKKSKFQSAQEIPTASAVQENLDENVPEEPIELAPWLVNKTVETPAPVVAEQTPVTTTIAQENLDENVPEEPIELAPWLVNKTTETPAPVVVEQTPVAATIAQENLDGSVPEEPIELASWLTNKATETPTPIVAEQEPVATPVPVAETAPVVAETTPVEAPAPVVAEQEPVVTPAPAVEATPVVAETAPVETPAPVVAEQEPVVTPAPAVEATPVVAETAPVETPAPVAAEQTPVTTPMPAPETTPVVAEQTPVATSAPMAKTALVMAEIASLETPDSVVAPVAAQKTQEVETIPVADVTPVISTADQITQAPVSETTAVTNEIKTVTPALQMVRVEPNQVHEPKAVSEMVDELIPSVPKAVQIFPVSASETPAVTNEVKKAAPALRMERVEPNQLKPQLPVLKPTAEKPADIEQASASEETISLGKYNIKTGEKIETLQTSITIDGTEFLVAEDPYIAKVQPDVQPEPVSPQIKSVDIEGVALLMPDIGEQPNEIVQPDLKELLDDLGSATVAETKPQKKTLTAEEESSLRRILEGPAQQQSASTQSDLQDLLNDFGSATVAETKPQKKTLTEEEEASLRRILETPTQQPSASQQSDLQDLLDDLGDASKSEANASEVKPTPMKLKIKAKQELTELVELDGESPSAQPTVPSETSKASVEEPQEIQPTASARDSKQDLDDLISQTEGKEKAPHISAPTNPDNKVTTIPTKEGPFGRFKNGFMRFLACGVFGCMLCGIASKFKRKKTPSPQIPTELVQSVSELEQPVSEPKQPVSELKQPVSEPEHVVSELEIKTEITRDPTTPRHSEEREKLATRLRDIKVLSEIKDKRAHLTREMAKAKRRGMTDRMDEIKEERQRLNEKRKEICLRMTGAKRTEVQKRRQQLTRQMTLARRKKDVAERTAMMAEITAERQKLTAQVKALNASLRKMDYQKIRKAYMSPAVQALYQKKQQELTRAA